jgi:inosine/xanthosine triphosphate pyrophosphatase family protein
MAEMSAEEKNGISHRGMALRKMADWIAVNLK